MFSASRTMMSLVPEAVLWLRWKASISKMVTGIGTRHKRYVFSVPECAGKLTDLMPVVGTPRRGRMAGSIRGSGRATIIFPPGSSHVLTIQTRFGSVSIFRDANILDPA